MAALCVVVTASWAGSPYPRQAMPAPRDTGALTAKIGATPIGVTLSLKLRNEQGAERLLEAISDSSSPKFRQFLTPQQFKTAFGASDQDVAIVAAQLAVYGLTAERTGASSLRVTGTAANMERAFQASMRQYNVPATGRSGAFHFQAPTAAPKIPAAVSDVVDGVIGLGTRPKFLPHNMHRLSKFVEGRVRLDELG